MSHFTLQVTGKELKRIYYSMMHNCTVMIDSILHRIDELPDMMPARQELALKWMDNELKNVEHDYTVAEKLRMIIGFSRVNLWPRTTEGDPVSDHLPQVKTNVERAHRLYREGNL